MAGRGDWAAGAIESVLIYVMEDTVGDGLFKLAFLREVRRRLPAARITWCAGVGASSYAGILFPLTKGLADEVIERAGIGARPAGLIGASPLGGRRFDLIIDTQTNLLRSLAARRIRHGLFVSASAGYRLSDRRPPRGTARPRHLIGFMTALLDLAVPVPGDDVATPALELDAGLRALAARLLPAGPTYIGIAPGAGDKAKIWPLENFIAIARDQAAKGRVPVFLLGPDEILWRDDIAKAVPEARFPEWETAAQAARGPLLTIALAERLSAAVANDSGAGHMLAAGGVALVSLFSKHEAEKYAPTVTRGRVVDSKSFGDTDPGLIPVEAVIDALEALLAAA